jgi:hypothetical protein
MRHATSDWPTIGAATRRQEARSSRCDVEAVAPSNEEQAAAEGVAREDAADVIAKKLEVDKPASHYRFRLIGSDYMISKRSDEAE